MFLTALSIGLVSEQNLYIFWPEDHAGLMGIGLWFDFCAYFYVMVTSLQFFEKKQMALTFFFSFPLFVSFSALKVYFY
ncbi:hypothetical protein CIPAW_14G075400 [Carya illinoinensis]|uniref:Uncharacterized protein n=1 Tax=Carya illinoinensis TaxID=32201 RepID=A0A8T1NHN1_CARIL|nr:hypothetical protein CIPAW_14G075400 [Carya illinoinensis]